MATATPRHYSLFARKMNPILLVLLIIMPFSLFAEKTKEEAFWKWFKTNEERIFNFPKDQEAIFDEVSEHLKKLDENLAFEVSSEKDGKRELVISADGIRDTFPVVEALKASEPKLKFWTVTAFRPRMENYTQFTMEQNGRTFDPKELWTYHRIEEGNFDLIIYYPKYTEEERAPFINGAYILLDMALGEYDVVTGIRYIDHQKLPENPEEVGLKPFSELRATFDHYKQTKANKAEQATP